MSKIKKALVVDDEQTSSLLLSSILRSFGYNVSTAASRDEMLDVLEREVPEAIFLDYRLGESDGLEVLSYLVANFPSLPIVMITAHGSIELALKAMHRGASGFITKPFNEENVERELNRSIWNRKINKSATNPPPRHSGIIGSSPAVLRIHDQIHKMKDVPTTVLITGESGTGKELIARALHNLSNRSAERFEAVNCAAIPENLLEAELFGYKRGAFTDAKTDRKGLFETCSNGTLFLDEIGEMPISLQSKLLRVLQEKVISPLGSSTSIPISTRIVAATNQNLKWLVNQNKFRKDLFYRLSILQIESPPLRERHEDIPELVHFFVKEICEKLGKEIRPLRSELLARLESHEWPGNIRELQNSLERAIVLSEDGVLAFDDIFSSETIEEATPEVSCDRSLTDAKDEFEKKYLEKLLSVTKGNVSQSARIAGRLRTDMYRLFNKHTLDPGEFKPH